VNAVSRRALALLLVVVVALIAGFALSRRQRPSTARADDGHCVQGQIGCACNTFGGCDRGACDHGVCAAARCELGAPGCGCLPNGRCTGPLNCNRGICFAADDPRPRNFYFYSDRSSQDVERIHALLLEGLGFAPGMHVADVGAGRGLLTVPVAERVGPAGLVYATDVDAQALTVLRGRVERVPAERRARVETRHVTRPRDTGLDDVAADSVDRMLMINVFGFGRNSPRDAAIAQLRGFARVLRPGTGRLAYHQDWLYPDNEFDRDRLTGLFALAGLQARGEIPMPAHIPEQAEVFQNGFDAPPKIMRRGYILLFGR